MRIAAKIVLAIAFLAVGTWLIWYWRWEVMLLLKGLGGIAVVFLGLILLALAKE